MNWVRHVPWNQTKDDTEADGDIPEEKVVDGNITEGGSEPSSRPEVIIVNTREKAPRQPYLSKKDAEKHGYTRGCGGCSSWFRGLARQPHTEQCRARFERLMANEAKVVNANARMEVYEDKMKRRKVEKESPKGSYEVGGSAGSGEKRKGEDIEEREVRDREEGGGLIWWKPKMYTEDEPMDPERHPDKISDVWK